MNETNNFDPRLFWLKNFPRATRSYILTLYEFVLEFKPENVLETGTQNGISSRTILLAMKENDKGKLVTVDRKDRSTILDDEFMDVKDRCKFVAGDSHSPETLQKVKNELGEDKLFDMFFIDGDHSYEGSKADFYDYLPMIKPGGIILMHDTVNTDAGVSRLWEEIPFEKFNVNWGWSRRRGLIPGFGICRKPLEIEKDQATRLIDDDEKGKDDLSL